MSVVFSASADTESYQHSSRIIEPILRFLFPHISQNALDFWVLVGRKCAHLTEYAILGWLFWRILRRPTKGDARPWRWREALGAVLLVAAYASTDEIHQIFVPHRQPAVHDVLIDTSGAVLGMILVRLVWGWGRGQKDGDAPNPATRCGAGT